VRRGAYSFAFGACLLGSATALWAQEGPFSEALLRDVRRAAMVAPGDLPTSLNVVTLNPFRTTVAAMVEGAPADSVDGSYPVFQIRFPRSWIAVDAALDRSFVPNSKTFSEEQYTRIQQCLRDAKLVVVTHEHFDHVAGVVQSPYLATIQQHTVLTRAQVQSLVTKPTHPRIKLDSSAVPRYIVLDYDPYLPIAPGVVLIKAAGHTTGSQMVYVRLANGKEVILVGDVAWNGAGVATQRQKPEASTRGFGGEDRAAIAQQLHWLKDVVPSDVTLVISHDQAAINGLIARGVLHQGFDFSNK
jgi:glyoxylase-like metal-dependent hydrolase (beta-lactamase superfamily II)